MFFWNEGIHFIARIGMNTIVETGIFLYWFSKKHEKELSFFPTGPDGYYRYNFHTKVSLQMLPMQTMVHLN